jgi:hypothetical protein
MMDRRAKSIPDEVREQVIVAAAGLRICIATARSALDADGVIWENFI